MINICYQMSFMGKKILKKIFEFLPLLKSLYVTFLKIHVAVDIKTKQITCLEITDDKFHDSKCFISLVEQSKQFGNVTKALADGA